MTRTLPDHINCPECGRTLGDNDWRVDDGGTLIQVCPACGQVGFRGGFHDHAVS